MKQYIIEKAYSDNYYYMLQYVDSKLECSTIVPYYELSGCVAALKDMGYERAYYVPEYERRLSAAKEKLDFATKEFSEAKEHPLEMINTVEQHYKATMHISC